jgi:hypothetical protein
MLRDEVDDVMLRLSKAFTNVTVMRVGGMETVYRNVPAPYRLL